MQNREKQIEEMAKDLCDSTMCDLETFNDCRMPQGNCSRCQRVAKDLYNAGYRKQSEGKWEKRVIIIFDSEKVGYKCSVCNTTWDTATNFCPNCGAHMRKEDEGK